MIRLMAPALLALAACGPVSVADAERQCFSRAKAATGPHGEVAIGAGTDGAKAKVSLSVNSDYIMGRDPSAVYDQCVYEKSGQPPSRPLYSRPDWKG